MPRFDSTAAVLAPRQANPELLRQEIAAAFGGRFVDANRTGDGATITAYLKGETVSDAATLLAVVRAHDPAGKAAEQVDGERQAGAINALAVEDFAALRTAIQNAATLAALRPILLALLRLIYRVVRAQGLTRQDEP